MIKSKRQMSKLDVFPWFTAVKWNFQKEPPESSVKSVFAEISPNSQENRVSFLKVCNLIKKEALPQVFSCEFCEISWNTFSTNFKNVRQTKRTKKDSFTEKKGKHGTEGNKFKCQLIQIQKPLAVSARELCHWEGVHHWGYTREFWAPPTS